MYNNLMAFLIAAFGVTLAEMGDKTQLLAMAFATRYKAAQVMAGVFAATVFNHALAVAVGNYITHFEEAQAWIQGIAALSFIFFGLWTIRGDKLEGEENRKTRFGPVMTVAIAFFIAELGDKTQLATIALAARYPASPLGILAGTTTGMLIADGIGIIVGVVMCRKIPERTIKLVSAGVFMLFGILGCFQVAVEKLALGLVQSLCIITVIAIASIIAAYFIAKRDIGEESEDSSAGGYCSAKGRRTSTENE